MKYILTIETTRALTPEQWVEYKAHMTRFSGVQIDWAALERTGHYTLSTAEPGEQVATHYTLKRLET